MNVLRRYSKVFASGVLAMWTVAAGAAEPLAKTMTFDIAPSPLNLALTEFAQQSGLQVVFVAEIGRDLRTAGLSGSFTPQAALNQLLANTPFAYDFLNPRTVTIRAAKGGEGKPVAESSSGASTNGMRLADAAASQAGDQSSTEKSGSGKTAEGPAGTKLEEIVVTATKRREERLQDIPASITVIGGQDIERRGLIGMEDYLRSIPGVNHMDRGNDNAIIIRGITTSPEGENFFSGNTVSMYFDETPITGAGGPGGGGIDIRPVDIERIEVLRGPQGSAFGDASLGGTLRIIPAKPKLDGFSAKLAADYSNTSGPGGDNSMIQGVVNLPIVRDRFAVRAVAYRYDESGFYRNIAGIDPATTAVADTYGIGDIVRGYVKDEAGGIVSTGGRVAASWKPTDKLDLSLTYLKQEIESDGALFANAGRYEQALIPVAAGRRVRGEVGDVNDTDVELASFVLSYDSSWATLTSVASRVDGGADWVHDLTWGAHFPISTLVLSEFRSFTTETRLASRLPGRLQFLAGVFYEKVDEDNFQSLDWSGSPATNFFGVDTIFASDLHRELDQRAVFGEVSYALTDRLIATAGGRYFRYKKNERGLSDSGENDSNLKANLSYKPAKDALLYASWAQGFRLGHPAAGLPPSCDPNNDGVIDGTSITMESTRHVDSDFLDSYEVGAKVMLFDRRMSVDTAIYHIDWEGLPVATSIGSPNCNLGYTANLGGATSEGAELQASVFVAEGLRVDFGAGYTNAKLSRDALGLVPPALKGDRLPGSPKMSANLAAQYDFNIGGRPAFVRADSAYVGTFYADLKSTPGNRGGDYIRLDARAGVAIQKLSVEIYVRNLMNEDAFTWRGLIGGASDNVFGYRMRPRTVGVQLGYNFE